MIKKELKVKNGTYTKDGKEVGRWVTVGHIHAGRDGGNDYMTIDAHVNFAAFPRRDGDTRVMVSMYDPRSDDRPARPQQSAPRAHRDPLDDDVPW